jgi:hypothetical protein
MSLAVRTQRSFLLPMLADSLHLAGFAVFAANAFPRDARHVVAFGPEGTPS